MLKKDGKEDKKNKIDLIIFDFYIKKYKLKISTIFKH